MAKIAFIGAGSFLFTRALVNDLLTFPRLRDATVALMDIDRERLFYIKQAVERIIREGKYPARVMATLSRQQALEGADAVICTILAGDVDAWQYDITIPKRFGVDINIGDTRSVSGVFRALRTIPVMLAICRDIERLCPRAILLNYTNPMAMLCRAMQSQTKAQVTGLCHSVQGTAGMLAGWIGAKADQVDYVCAGINHQAWFLKFEWRGRDAYPRIRKAILANKKIRNAEQVRNEMFLHLDYYVTESSGHNSEYNWWFRKRPDLIEKYCTHGTNWNPGRYAYILTDYQRRKSTWRKVIRRWLDDPKPLDLKRGHEYATSIINARMGGETLEFNGNVPNTGIIPNLPAGCCVEVPVFADRQGFRPVYVGALPPQLAALNNASIAVEEMAVAAALTGDPRKVFHAIAYDPLSAAVLSLNEIKRMVQTMLNKNKAHLPQFKRLKID
ncbi:MAG: alpha-galactosidase [Lentisphaerae bacterium]|nr:alpha-galactosidase [Lentisphaerota bacterium]